MWAVFFVTLILSLGVSMAYRRRLASRASVENASQTRDPLSPGSSEAGRSSFQSRDRDIGSSCKLASSAYGILGWSVVVCGLIGMWFLSAHRRPDAGLLLRALVLLLLAWLVGRACDRYPVARWMRISAVLFLNFAAALWVASFDVIDAPFSHNDIQLGPCSVPLTTAYMFVVTYAFFGTNLLPGLTLGLTSVIALTLFVVGLLQPQTTGALSEFLVTPLAGVALGQWRLAMSPVAKRLDSGTALSLGLALAIISVAGALKDTAFLVIFLPILVLGTPLLNVTYAMFQQMGDPVTDTNAVTIARRRIRLHDALLREGVPPQRVTSLLVALDTYLCFIALLLVMIIRVSYVVKLLLLVPALLLGWLLFYTLAKLFSRTASSHSGQPIHLLNISISPVTMSEALQRVDEFVASRKPHMIVTSDSSAIVRAQQDPEFFQIVNEADLVTPDGIGVVLSARLLNLPIFERVSGCDMVAGICQLSARKGHRLFFLGAAPGIAEQAAENLSVRHPGMVIAGTHHGYFQPEEEESIVAMVRATNPDVLLVALGIPRQEKFIRRHMHQMQVPVCLGVGGSLDVYAGVVKRAPAWIQKMGMEWLYRSAPQPKRWGRLVTIPRLLLMTLKHKRSVH